jgi:adenylate cyclase
MTGVAGAIVVFIAIGFLIPVFINAHDTPRLALISGPLVAAYLVVSGLTINRVFGRHLARAVSWIVADRPPDEREHRMTLGLAVHAVKLDALAWTLAALLFAVLTGIVHSWGFGLVVGATIWLGGETACALDYLLYERVLRPLTACALAAYPSGTTRAPGVRGRLTMAWLLGTGVPLLGVLVIGALGATKSGVHTSYVAAAVLFLGAVATAAGLLAILFASKAIAEPLLAVRRGLDRVEEGDLDVHVSVDDGSEVGLLQAGFNRMADGLRERERIRDLFGRHVGAEVAHAALTEGVRFGGEEREIGALFVDLVGSTSLALAVPPTEVVRVLNRFFRVIVEVVEQRGGLVNKFEGDAALCLFGAPVACDDPAGDALLAARGLAARLSHDLPELDFGIGVSAGVAVAGNVGAQHRFEYTVIGDPVNEAARLAELAKQRPERVLASDAALERATGAEAEAWNVTESSVLRGRAAPTRLAHPRA